MFVFVYLLLLCLIVTIDGNNGTKFEIAWNNFTQDSQLLHASYAITVLDDQSGDIFFAYNQDVGLSPASTMKTVTGAAAFHYLGPDYRYATMLQYSGSINATGFLDGYIYIVGTGDPTLGSIRWNQTNGNMLMSKWVNITLNAGITSCRGIILDLSAWPGKTQTVPDGYPWEDLGNYYGTGHSALNWRENEFRIGLMPGPSVGSPVAITWYSNLPVEIAFINELVTGPPGTGDGTNVYLAPDGVKAYLRGSLGIDVARNFSIRAASTNAALFLGHEFRQQMNWPNDMNIAILHQTSNNTSLRVTLDTNLSPNLSDIIFWFEQASINMYGEVLVNTVAYATNMSVTDVLPYYCQDQHHIEQTAVATIDGSGLSPQNRITTWAIANVLYNIRQCSTWFPAFERALPIANGISMKGGYIRNVLSYSGYVNNRVFSVIVNNFNGVTSVMRQKIWKLLDVLKL